MYINIFFYYLKSLDEQVVRDPPIHNSCIAMQRHPTAPLTEELQVDIFISPFTLQNHWYGYTQTEKLRSYVGQFQGTLFKVHSHLYFNIFIGKSKIQ